jgi:hypothetical protein
MKTQVFCLVITAENLAEKITKFVLLLPTAHGLEGQALVPDRVRNLSSAPLRPNQLWGHSASYPMGILDWAW